MVHHAPVSTARQGLQVLLDQGSIPLLLHVTHTNLQNGLLLGGQAALHIRLDTAQQEGTQHLVQLLHHLGLLLLASITQAEPLLELLCAAEHLRQQEVEQGPQLVQVVLQGGTGDEQAIVGAEHAHHAGKHGVLVLDAVSLVNDDVAPVEALEVVLLLKGQRGQQRVNKWKWQCLSSSDPCAGMTVV